MATSRPTHRPTRSPTRATPRQAISPTGAQTAPRLPARECSALTDSSEKAVSGALVGDSGVSGIWGPAALVDGSQVAECCISCSDISAPVTGVAKCECMQ